MSLLFFVLCCFFFCKQKTAYEMRISDWSSDVCSSDLPLVGRISDRRQPARTRAAVGADLVETGRTGDCVSYVIRAAKPGDLQSIYEMAKLTGGGFTNLPPDKKALRGDRKSTRLNSSH